jgi:zinc D-Ala-D-Ala dipeptidase
MLPFYSQPYTMKNLAFFSFLLVFVTSPEMAWTQKKAFSSPPLIKSTEELKAQLKKDSTLKLVELRSLIPDLAYDLRYATKNNFTQRRLYPKGTQVAFLRLPAARALRTVQQKLKQKGWGLKIYDAYRPYAVTVKFWKLIKDERYVANPSKGSGHNRGTAVDLTIIDLASGKELDMGTGYDDFSEKAHQSFKQLPQEVITNRNLLKYLMLEAGFVLFETEWWHYSLPNATRYDLLDLSFKKIKRTL